MIDWVGHRLRRDFFSVFEVFPENHSKVVHSGILGQVAVLCDGSDDCIFFATLTQFHVSPEQARTGQGAMLPFTGQGAAGCPVKAPQAALYAAGGR